MTNYDQLIKVLKELFQLNQAELDFGIYRILNHKRDEISAFLERQLIPQVQAIIAQSNLGDKSALEAELAEKIAQARQLGVADPDSLDTVKLLRSEIARTPDPAALENEIFSHLAAFFKRYYKDGDFISMRRYKKDVYAIPYEGEEVKLYWANHDQYYIKTAEHLKNYAFKLPHDRLVRFELAEANTEKDNRKEESGKERRFRIYAEKPVETEGNTLRVFFSYEPSDKKEKQEDLNAAALALVKKHLPADWAADVLQKAPTDKNKDRSLLEKHINDFTARNTFDYFIHKDLGGFLGRELDFYIKNEVLHLDDVQPDEPAELRRQLVKIRALRDVGGKIIAFLAQLENFQKKLWLKKKFITDTQYCITLDRIPEAFYPEIAANDAQRQEWLRLFAIDEIQADLVQPPYSVPLTVDFLQSQPFLVLDTAFFSEDFKLRLIAAFDNLDEQLDGLLINSENFQALNLLQERYKEQVKCVYIDPPYNTGGDGFFYKDSYKHSSWLSMIFDRIKATYNLISNNGVLYSSIDAVERSQLEHTLISIFTNENRVEEIIWVQNTTKNQSPTFSTNHEYICVFSKDIEVVKKDFKMFRETKPGFDKIQELIEKINPEYPTIDEIRKALRNLFKERRQRIAEEGGEYQKELDEWKGLYNYSNADYRDENGKYVPEKDAKTKKAKIWIWREDNPSMPQVKEDSQKDAFRDPLSPEYRFYQPVHPITGRPCPAPKRGWSWPYEPYGRQTYCFRDLALDERISWGDDEKKIPQTKRFLNEVETNVAKSVVNDYTDGEKQLTDLFGKTRSFSNPKPTTLITRFCAQSSIGEGYCMDYFAGSGTTGHAVINLNREDGGRRKYILVEMGQYFDTVTKPRIQKVIYSAEWKDGKPVGRRGSSHAFKYLRLESYEDALNNLQLRRSTEQQQLLDLGGRFAEEYLLHYWLDTESAGSLLSVAAFERPFDYRLRIIREHEALPTRIDMVETFNYLIGLRVESSQRIRGFHVVSGQNLAGERILVIWRNTGEQDNAALDAFFQKQGYNTRDREYDRIYVNGDNNLENLKTGDEQWKVGLIEEEFLRRMFDVQDV